MACKQYGNWFIDARSGESSDALSLDLSRHLPRRLAVGMVLVLANNPRVFLSVIRKRLARLTTAIERRRSQTMDARKRSGLAQELFRLRTYRFSAKALTRLLLTDALFVSPECLPNNLATLTTVYLTTPLRARQLICVLEQLAVGGLLVTYGPWPEHYETVLNEYEVYHKSNERT